MAYRIEYRDLANMGATREQLATYSNCWPLWIYEEDDGSYSIGGMIEAESLTAEEVLEYLDDLGEEEE